MDLKKLRNIGISAHIDSGKTTLSERILFYSGRIHKIEEVRGGGDGATMDHMELEKERGITITSAATSVSWNSHPINLIDTPGHVDFTVEVERSLRVLDGAILVLCSVGGVQAQSLTVDRQMKRYKVPRLAFINKMDRTGANPDSVIKQMRDKLGVDAIAYQIPIGKEDNFQGVVDLIEMEAIYYDGDQGEKVRKEAIPADLQDKAQEARHDMLEALSNYSDEIMELLLSEEEVPNDLIYKTTHDAVVGLQITPVFMGTAFKNKGVQTLLDAIVRYLPSPLEVKYSANTFKESDEKVPLACDPKAPFVGMAFKIVEDPYGQLTFMRIYQGSIEKGQPYVNQRTGKTERFARIVRMHSNKREEIDSAGAGDIVAVTGIDCASGDTYAKDREFCSLENIFVPIPVIKISVAPKSRDDSDKLSKALQRFRKEDPTFHVFTDPETNETIIAGMGELHLDVYVERIRREYKVEVVTGPPKVSYRESPTQPVEYNYKHKKQTGGSGQFAHIVGSIEPIPQDTEGAENFVFEDKISQGRIPKEYIPAVQRGFEDCMSKGPLAEFPVVGVKVILNDGSYHDVDSSEMAFKIAAQGCFRENFMKMKPTLLEPIMNVEVEIPEAFQGPVTGDIIVRRGMVNQTDMNGDTTVISAEIPLAAMFGYATELRSMTQGQGTFSMELGSYKPTPSHIQEEVVAERRKELEMAK
ncbi:elongation factor G [Blastopirellula marina]|uniref:Elongation factor G n=1 Tax=Blastopirellula marina TaxID=124 RepID=A0A2S8FEY3_9BACT|nr:MULTISPECIES: elongation factor G [Pirellulaceae]PQO30728.1 elongation factor G [Blastopirellula marina]RCS50865.1 elongation factor G [Bremerella cremea]